MSWLHWYESLSPFKLSKFYFLNTQTQKTLVKSAEKLTEMPEADATKLYETNTFHYLLTYMRHLDFNGLRKVADFALLGTKRTSVN